MKIRIISVEKSKQQFVLDGEAEYLKRLKNEVKIECVSLSLGLSANLSEVETKRREADGVLPHLKGNEYIVVLDEYGDEYSSQQFAQFIQQRRNQGTAQVSFLIGGAYGWDDSIKKKAQKVLSLSKLTFTYQMSRLILIEQLYRASMILKGVPYHKG